MIDLRFFFPATENHDQDPANYEIHVMTLAKCVVKRYFRIRCLSYLKMLNQKHNPDPSIRNAILKKTSVYRFVIKNFEIKLICFVYFICVKFNLNTPAALDFYWSMRHVVRGSGDQAALVVSVAHLLSLGSNDGSLPWRRDFQAGHESLPHSQVQTQCLIKLTNENIYEQI